MRKTKNEEFSQEVPRFLLFFVCKGTGGLPVTLEEENDTKNHTSKVGHETNLGGVVFLFCNFLLGDFCMGFVMLFSLNLLHCGP